jgi:hypothetical protein
VFAGVPIALLITDYRTLFALGALAFALVSGEGRELRAAFGLSTAASLVAVVLQGKGFAYHFIPALVGTIYLLVLATQAVPRRRLALGIAVALALLLGLVQVVSAPANNDPRWKEIREAQDHIAGKAVIVLSPVFGSVWPHVSYAGGHWKAPIPCVWPLRSGQRGVRLAVEWILPAITAGEPVLVPVPPTRNALPELLEDADFRAAWGAYRLASRGRHYVLYTADP